MIVVVFFSEQAELGQMIVLVILTYGAMHKMITVIVILENAWYCMIVVVILTDRQDDSYCNHYSLG